MPRGGGTHESAAGFKEEARPTAAMPRGGDTHESAAGFKEEARRGD